MSSTTREQLVDAATQAGIELRQSYARVGKAAEHQAGRYARAKQYRRMHREIRKLRTWLGHVIRDVQPKGGELAGALKAKVDLAQRLFEQRRISSAGCMRCTRRRSSASPKAKQGRRTSVV